jgi:hypothetical protein
VADNQPSTKGTIMTNQVTAGAMKPSDVLNVRRVPGRLTADQTAALLGFSSHDIPYLIRAKLLKPIGKPQPNSCKWFASCEIEELRNSSKWLDAATKAVSEWWRTQNARRRNQAEKPSNEIT